jgi:alkanesulfonate monooxygenase SsuD/methylene tetrahydromethanopterin reductase-like flavin-dependent oxidoreductase (luciferase family)
MSLARLEKHMEFGVAFFPTMGPDERAAGAYYDDSIRLAELADELGFAHVQIVEHYFTPYGGYSPDPVPFLAAVAARTSLIRVTTGAVLPAFAHPLQLAGKLAMLDNLSHGRLDVGFGRAFLPGEFEAFGVGLDESRDRFAAGIDACRRLWSETDVTVDTPWWRFGPVTMLPRPYQQPHPPIFVASATSPESCAAAGRAGYHLQAVPTVTSREGLQEMLAAYRAARASAGHAGPGQIQLKYTCYLNEDGALAVRLARHWEQAYMAKMVGAVAAWATVRSADYPGYDRLVEKARRYDFDAALAGRKVLAGSPDEVTEQVSTVAGWFGDDLTLSLLFNPGCLPAELAERAAQLFAAKVVPALSG